MTKLTARAALNRQEEPDRIRDAAMTGQPLRPPPQDKPIGRARTGRIVYTPPLELAHKCDPPMRSGGFIPVADAPSGAIWLCGRCGRYWTAEDSTWRPAMWHERRKARKANRI